MAVGTVGGKDWYKNVRTTDTPEDLYLKIATWGKHGSGKTTLMGTADKPFIIALEKGTLTLAGLGIPYFQFFKDMPIYDTLMFILQSARKKEVLKDDDGNIIFNWPEIETICLDGATKLSELLIIERERKTGHKPLQIPDWGIVGSQMREVVTQLNDLPYHIIQSCGENVSQDREDEDELEVIPDIQGGYKHRFLGEFDFVLYMEERTRGSSRKYIAHTSKYRGRVAKARVPLPREIEDCTFSFLKEKVAEKLKEK